MDAKPLKMSTTAPLPSSGKELLKISFFFFICLQNKVNYYFMNVCKIPWDYQMRSIT